MLLVGELEEDVAAFLTQEQERLRYRHLPSLDRYQLLGLYPACDFTVLSSFYDGMPNVLLESAALGVPLLAAITGGMADVLVDGRHGVLFPPQDRSACRAAIARCLRMDEAERAALGARCQELARVDLNAAQETERYLTMLRQLLPAAAHKNGARVSHE